MSINWSEEALADLTNILEHAADRDRLEADNIVRRILAVEENLVLFPHAAHYDEEYDFFERFVPGTRLILIYREVGDDLNIIAVFHTSRDPSDKPKLGGS